MSPVSKARLEGNKRYLEKLEEIKFRVPKGRKAEIQAAAVSSGESLNGYVTKAVDERMERDMERLNGSEGDDSEHTGK